VLQVGEAEELTSCGALAFYDKAADRVTPKTPAKLRKTGMRTRATSASDDPVMRRLAQQGAAEVFITDDVLVTLMCAPRSTYPWDIVISKRGNVLVFDKRANSSLDFLTVSGACCAAAWVLGLGVVRAGRVMSLTSGWLGCLLRFSALVHSLAPFVVDWSPTILHRC
jgi:hypothetical protein